MNQKHTKQFSVIVKVTKNCNLRCKYCYVCLGDKVVMDKKTLENMIRKFSSYKENIEFVWHGGEPLLAGKDFYQRVIDIQNECLKYDSNVKIVNSLQTNGILLNNQNLFKFLVENKFNIGVSCDGPAEIQNITRPLVSGEGSFDKLHQGIDNLKKYENCLRGICVVSKYNAVMAEEVYNHYKSKGFSSLKTIPYEGREENLKLDSKEFFEFHRDLYRCWVSDKTPIKEVVPITTIVHKLLGGYHNHCYYLGSCFENFFAVDTNGDVLPCCTFEEPVLGNVNMNTIQEIFSSPKLEKVRNIQKEVRKKCNSSCDYAYVCNSGCRGAALLTYEDLSTKDPSCEGRYMLIDYIKRDLEERLERATIVPEEGS